MIVVKLEMWPFGSEKRKYELGRTYIFNTGKGSQKRGDYKVRVCRKGNYEVNPEFLADGKGATRVGEVCNYPRKSYNVWRLIIRALLNAFPEEQKAPDFGQEL